MNCAEAGGFIDSLSCHLDNLLSEVENDTWLPSCKLCGHHVDNVTERLLKEMDRCSVACCLYRGSRNRSLLSIIS